MNPIPAPLKPYDTHSLTTMLVQAMNFFLSNKGDVNHRRVPFFLGDGGGGWFRVVMLGLYWGSVGIMEK